MSSVDLQGDIKQIEHLLSRPASTPNEFSTWIVYWLQQNIDISTYQVRGLASTFFKAAPVIAAEEAVSSTTFANMATVGPTLSGLSNGKYLAFWGANGGSTVAADCTGLMGISPNGAGPSSVHVARSHTKDFAEQIPMIYSYSFDLDGNDQNYLQAKYLRVSGGNPKFWNRWLVAVQTAR